MSKLTDNEWRDFQSIPEQGYSHRHWIDYHIAVRIAKAFEEAAEIAFSYDPWDDPHTAAEAIQARAADVRMGLGK